MPAKKSSSRSPKKPAITPSKRSRHPPAASGTPPTPSAGTLSSVPSENPASSTGSKGGLGTPLLRLEKPFDVDEFCQQLGETRITATVPREHLTEVLKRVVEFMEFGIYVYAVVVLPAASPTMEKFTLTLDRIDFDTKRHGWIPFQEKGRSESPFGPQGKGPSGSAPHA